MTLQPGYSKVRIKTGDKFYAPSVTFLGKTLHLKRVQRTATQALNYSRKFCKTWERFTHGKEEEIPSHQS